MTVQQPTAEKNLDGYGFPPIEWERVRAALEAVAPIPPEEPSGRYWLGTVRPDGRPHLMPVGILWHDGVFWFTAGARTQKARNIARDPRCVVSIATTGIDIVAEGTAEKVTDESTLQRLADAYGAGGWQPTVRDGAFWHEYSAPSAGPPPWDLYRVTPTTFYGLASAEPYGATRWRL